MKLWEYPIYGKDGGKRITIRELIKKLRPLAQEGKEVEFSKTIDEYFLGGSWGFIFEILEANKESGGYHWHTFAADIRGLVWACLKEEP